MLVLRRFSSVTVCFQDTTSAAPHGRPVQKGSRRFCSGRCASVQPKDIPALEAARKLLPRIAQQHDTDAVLLESVLALQALQLCCQTPADAATQSSDSHPEVQLHSDFSQQPAAHQPSHPAIPNASMRSMSVSDANPAPSEAASPAAVRPSGHGAGDSASGNAASHNGRGPQQEQQAAGQSHRSPARFLLVCI